jgi:hypothetical protein
MAGLGKRLPIVGIPSGRSPPPGFGIITRRTARGCYVFARRSFLMPRSHSSNSSAALRFMWSWTAKSVGPFMANGLGPGIDWGIASTRQSHYDHERTGARLRPSPEVKSASLSRAADFYLDRKPLVHESHDKDHKQIPLSASLGIARAYPGLFHLKLSCSIWKLA